MRVHNAGTGTSYIFVTRKEILRSQPMLRRERMLLLRYGTIPPFIFFFSVALKIFCRTVFLSPFFPLWILIV
jgi:hypothetical protein